MRRFLGLAILAAAVGAVGAPATGAAERRVEAPAVAPGCDPLGGQRCLLPWPNDYFTRRAKTPTGRTLALTASMMPRNAAGVPIEPADYNHSDGFSPGQTIVVKVPGLDTPEAFARTGAGAGHRPRPHLRPPGADRGDQRPDRTAAPDLGRDRLEREHAGEHRVADPPGVNFREGERYIVALRRPQGRRRKTDRGGPRLPALPRPRRTRLSRVRGAAGPTWSRSSARCARPASSAATSTSPGTSRWRASARCRAGSLSIRDRAFAELGDRNLRDLQGRGRLARFTVDTVIERTPAEEPNVSRRVEGHVTVPCFLDAAGCPSGSRYDLGPDGLPQRIPGNTYDAPLRLQHPALGQPRRARRARRCTGTACSATPARWARATSSSSATRTTCSCAPRTGSGWPRRTSPTRSAILQDLSRFPSLADRLQQGFLDFMFLGRTMIHPPGFASNPAFQRDGRPLIDTRRLFYYGNSQGGIAGGALTARGAGLQPLGALRRRDELQPAADAQHRLRPLRR